MLNHQLSGDTQAILLVTSNLGKEGYGEAKPLTLKEYKDLEVWLNENQMRPEDLLTATGRKKLEATNKYRLDNRRIITLLERGVMLSLTVEKWTSQGIWIIGREDGEYPQSLKENLQDLAPLILYGVGEKELLSRGGLAVVGSRDIDEEGIDYTQRVAATCAREGIQIVSGGARGVDINAMLAAVEAGGTALGVLPDSLTKAAVSGKYRQNIREGRLTLICPWGANARFSIGNAMGRNKYIYALSDRALVVSSAFRQGGTWAGALDVLDKIKNVPLFVRMQGNVPVGNRELQKLGAIAFPEEPWESGLWELLDEAISRMQQETTFDLFSQGIGEIVAPPQQELLRSEETDADVEEEVLELNDTEADVEEEILEPEEKAIVVKEEATPEVSGSQSVVEYEPQNIYEAVLPLILRNLKEPLKDKELRDRLELTYIGDLKQWLKIAVKEGKVTEDKKLKTYVAKQPAIEYGPRDIYEAVLPFILRNLEEPLKDKVLAERLEVQVKQLGIWLDRAVDEGKVTRNRRNCFLKNI